MMRIGFVGEMGWEIMVPAEYGSHLWEQVLHAGAAVDLRPFGVEAQRVLRLEKKHIIVGVDTDALSNPYEAGMAWVAKLDKADFIGKVRSVASASKPLSSACWLVSNWMAQPRLPMAPPSWSTANPSVGLPVSATPGKREK